MTHASHRDARLYPLQVAWLYLTFPAQGRELARELDDMALNVAAAEVQIRRLSEGRLVSLETIRDELTSPAYDG
jgi:hypothetical protein